MWWAGSMEFGCSFWRPVADMSVGCGFVCASLVAPWWNPRHVHEPRRGDPRPRVAAEEVVHACAGPSNAAAQTQFADSTDDRADTFPITLIVIGVLLMSFGFKAYKWIVLLNFIAIGWWLGTLPVKNELAQKGRTIWRLWRRLRGGADGIVAWPLLKYAVAVCGGGGFCDRDGGMGVLRPA